MGFRSSGLRQESSLIWAFVVIPHGSLTTGISARFFLGRIAVLRTQMRPVNCYRWSSVVGLSAVIFQFQQSI